MSDNTITLPTGTTIAADADIMTRRNVVAGHFSALAAVEGADVASFGVTLSSSGTLRCMVFKASTGRPSMEIVLKAGDDTVTETYFA